VNSIGALMEYRDEVGTAEKETIHFSMRTQQRESVQEKANSSNQRKRAVKKKKGNQFQNASTRRKCSKKKRGKREIRWVLRGNEPAPWENYTKGERKKFLVFVMIPGRLPGALSRRGRQGGEVRFLPRSGKALEKGNSGRGITAILIGGKFLEKVKQKVKTVEARGWERKCIP